MEFLGGHTNLLLRMAMQRAKKTEEPMHAAKNLAAGFMSTEPCIKNKKTWASWIPFYSTVLAFPSFSSSRLLNNFGSCTSKKTCRKNNKKENPSSLQKQPLHPTSLQPASCHEADHVIGIFRMRIGSMHPNICPPVWQGSRKRREPLQQSKDICTHAAGWNKSCKKFGANFLLITAPGSPRQVSTAPIHWHRQPDNPGIIAARICKESAGVHHPIIPLPRRV